MKIFKLAIVFLMLSWACGNDKPGILQKEAHAQMQCSCDSCHKNPPMEDAHDHFTKIKQGLTCDSCHFGGMQQEVFIIDTKFQLGFSINGKDGTGMTYDGLSKPVLGTTYQATNNTTITQTGSMQCINVYCHGGGTGGTNNMGGISKSSFLNKFGDPRPIAASTSPAWTNLTSIGCNFCHGIGTTNGQPIYSQDEPKSNSHSAHSAVKCNACHYATTTDGATIADVTKHHNGIYDLTPGPGMDGKQVSFIYTSDPGGGECKSVSCHSGFSKTWGNKARGVYLNSSRGTISRQIILNALNSSNGTYMGPPPYTYEWDFGDGTVETGTANTTPITTTHVYPAAGIYTAIFNFRDGKYHPGSGTMSVYPKIVY